MASRKSFRLSDSILLKRERFFWKGRAILPAWVGFQVHQAAHGGISRSKPPTGRVRIFVEPPGTSEGTPSSAQVKAWEYLEANQERLREKALQAIFRRYPEWKKMWEDLIDDNQMSNIDAPLDFKNLINLSIIHIDCQEKSGYAFTGLEFGCSWDEEHGLGVKMHKQKVLDVGSADCSF